MCYVQIPPHIPPEKITNDSNKTANCKHRDLNKDTDKEEIKDQTKIDFSL